MDTKTLSELIKHIAADEGFCACGITKAEELTNSREHLHNWLEMAYNASLGYMERNLELRLNPSLFFDGAESIIVVAINYKPPVKQKTEAPQVAYFAYNEDYHIVIKQKLENICGKIKQAIGTDFKYRTFTDSAPLLERELARRAGLGWIGKNSNLIIPKTGSFVLLGEIVCKLKLSYDTPFEQNYCGACRRCQMACPTRAITSEKLIDASKCISFHTIENKEDIPKHIKEKLNGYIFGCDICLNACPYNKTSPFGNESSFAISELISNLSKDELLNMTEGIFNDYFKNSPLERAGLEKLKNNLKPL